MDLLVFEIADSVYGVRTEFVREVQRAVSLSAVPAAAPSVLGAMNLRGQMVLVVDLRGALGAIPKPVAPTDHFVLVSRGERPLALRVDRARELLRIEPTAIAAAADVLPTSEFVVSIARVGDEFVHVIDPAKLGDLLEAR